MAGLLQSLLGFKGRLTIGDVTVDASVEETHAVTAETTDHPVEEGADISDHYRVDPRQFKAECIVTNTPLATSFPGATLITSVKNLVQDSNPVEAAWNTLKDYMDGAVLVPVNTSLETYDNIMITNLSTVRRKGGKDSLKFSISGKQLRQVSLAVTSAIDIPETKKPKTTTTQSKKSGGRKPNKDASPEKRKSLAAKAFDKGGSFFK